MSKAIVACVFLGVVAHQQTEDTKAFERRIKTALSKGDLQELQRLASSAVKAGSVEQMRVLVGVLGVTESRAYWILLDAMRELSADTALDALTDDILKAKESTLALDLTFTISRTKSESRFPALGRLLREGSDEIQMACLDPIVVGERKEFVPQIVEMLETQEHRDGKKPGRVYHRLLWALRNLTGLDMPSARSWKEWWSKNRDSFECPKLPGSDKGSGGTLVTYVKRSRSAQYEELTKGGKKRIVALSTAHSDSKHLHSVLDTLGISYTLVTGKDLVEKEYLVKEAFCIFVPCCPEGATGKKFKEILRSFVESGGWILANGMAVEQVIQHAFPGCVKPAGTRQSDSIVVSPVRGRLSDPFLRMVFEESGSVRWGCVPEASGFSIFNEKGVVVAEAVDMGPKRGTPAPVAGYFRFGLKDGLVAIIAPRFSIDSDVTPSLQNLVLNFLIEAQENWRARGGK